MYKIYYRYINEVLFSDKRKTMFTLSIVMSLMILSLHVSWLLMITPTVDIEEPRHLNLKLLKYLESHDLVRGLLSISNKTPSPCGPCQQGKQKHVTS